MTRIHRFYQRHLYFASQCVFILLDFNAHFYFIKYRNLCLLLLPCQSDGIVICVELNVLLERDKTLDSESGRGWINESGTLRNKTYFDTNTPMPFLNVRMTNASSVTRPVPICSAFSPRAFSASPT